MGFCAESTFNETWNCLREENGELLPLIFFAECMWWIFMLVIMRGIVQGIRRWREKKKLGKRMRQEWEDKWSFPPKRNN
jgi:hypothetical protein